MKYDLSNPCSEYPAWERFAWAAEENPHAFDAGFRATAVEVDTGWAIQTEKFADRQGLHEMGLRRR